MMSNSRLALVEMGNHNGNSVRYLASYVKAQGFPTNLLFLLLRGQAAFLPEALIPRETFQQKARLSGGQMARLLAFLKDNDITHLGFSLMTGNLRAFQEVVPYLRRGGWKGCIIAGGIHPTLCPDESLCEGVDFVVMGPGELPLVDILRNRSPEGVSGLVYRRDGGIVRNPILDEAYLKLETLPFPDYDFEDHYLIRDDATIHYGEAQRWKPLTAGGWYYFLTTGRGCPYHCQYCCNVNSRHLSRASVGRVMEELHWAKAKMPFLHGCGTEGDDSFFTGSDDWLREFSTRFKAEFGWPLIINIMPRFCTRERLLMLKEGGLKFACIGLQGSERLNREFYHRYETNDSFVKACDMMAELGISYSVDVILDSPYETEDDLREVCLTLNRLRRPFRVRAFSMTPFPGTPFYDRVVADGLLDKFASDPYESAVAIYASLTTASRPDVYRTPLYWYKLIQKILCLYDGKEIDRLIEVGPHNPAAIAAVDRLYDKAARRWAFAERFRTQAPKLFEKTLDFYIWWKRRLASIGVVSH